MKHYSQHIRAYKKIRLGTCNTSLWASGCFVCSLAMLSNRYTPEQVNDILTNNGGFTNGCMVNSKKASKLLNIKYDGKTTKKPRFICIAETNHYRSLGVPQHFFIFAPKGTVSGVSDLMLDPLDSQAEMVWRPIKYKIVSYRLFHEYVDEFQQAWDSMLSKKIFSEYTKKDDYITTDELAVFLDRLIKYLK